MYLYSSYYAMIFVRSHICREENTQPGLKIYRLAWPSFLFQWVSAFSLCLYSYSTSFSLLRFFPAIFPSFLLHPSLFSDLFISTFLFIILPMYKMKDRKGKEYTSTKLLSHIVREEECWRLNNFHFATQWIQFLSLSLLLTHIISRLSPFTKSVSSPFLRLFFHSFCIFSQPWR